MIDKSFRELKKSTTLHVTQPHKKATLNREELNKVAINDLYDREDSIQKSIFYYNNEILNKVVNKMVRKPQKHKNPLERDEESQYNAPPEGGQRG
jgi:hypothetical protein